MTRYRRQLAGAIIALVMVASALAGIGAAAAANPDTVFFDYGSGTCRIAGTSSYTTSPLNGYSNTIYYTGSQCASTYHVHAYFWGSDLAYHYYEKDANFPGAQVPDGGWTWWTNSVYGYHRHPSTGSPTYGTHAY